MIYCIVVYHESCKRYGESFIMERWVLRINLIVFIVLTVFYLYQFVYVGVVLFRKHRTRQCIPCTFHRFGVVIAARNESMVIGNLIRSIQNQTYPQKLVDIFVVADNCTDDTARIARQAGAVVYERSNTLQVGKGYALDFAFHNIARDYGDSYYDAYLIFDADNLLDCHYIDEMNVVFNEAIRSSPAIATPKTMRPTGLQQVIRCGFCVRQSF